AHAQAGDRGFPIEPEVRGPFGRGKGPQTRVALARIQVGNATQQAQRRRNLAEHAPFHASQALLAALDHHASTVDVFVYYRGPIDLKSAERMRKAAQALLDAHFRL